MSIDDFFSKRLVKTMVISVVFSVGIFFSFYKLVEAPSFWFDEGYFTQAAMNVARYGVWGIQTEQGSFTSLLTVSGGFPLIAPLALMFKIFGIGVFQARLLVAFFIAGFIVSSFVVIKRLYGFYYGAGAALLIGTFPVLYGNGKTVLGEVPGLLFYVLFLGFLSQWITSNKKKDALYAGLMFGLVMTSKVSFLLVCIPATIILFFLYRKQIQQNAIGARIFIGAMLVSILIWIVTQFGSSDTLNSFYQTTFHHYNSVPASQLFITNSKRFFTEFSPFVLFVFMCVWGTSVGLRVYAKKNVPIAETHAALFSLFVIGIFLLSPGWYRYFFPAQIVALLFFPSALHDVIVIIHSCLRRFPIRSSIVCTFVIGSLSLVQGYQTGFHSFVAGYYHSDKTLRMQQEFSLLDVHPTYFFYNTPEVLVFVPDLRYYQYIGSDFVRYVIGGEQLEKITNGTADKIVIVQQRYLGHEREFALYEPEKIVAGKYLILKKREIK